MGKVRMINKCESITGPLQLMRRYVQAHAKIKMITISPALPKDVKKHMMHFLWQMQAECTLKPPVFTLVQFFIYFKCLFFIYVNSKGLPTLNFWPDAERRPLH